MKRIEPLAFHHVICGIALPSAIEFLAYDAFRDHLRLSLTDDSCCPDLDGRRMLTTFGD
jgi:hypothetical protein